MSHAKFDVFVGTKSGLIKGLKIGRVKKENKIKNLQKVSLITENDKVTRIAWDDNNEQEILVACSAYKDNKVKIFDAESAVLKDWFSCNIGIGNISGVSRCGRSILTSVKSGEICLWTDGKGELLIKTDDNLNRMCHSREHTNLIATGGEENKLRMYDLEMQKQIFSAKDLPHDWLRLRRCIPISDISFLPGNQLVTVGKYGNIHLYDPCRQRRPVIDMTVKDEAWTCLDVTPKEKHIIVGSTKGKLNLIDLRQPGTVLNTYKGFIGGVTGVACSKINPYVASVSLDRHLRIHHIHTKECLKCIYLTSKLSCLVMRSDICIEIGYEDGTEN
ncbi:WD repeat-containing protein 74 [Trachymyrmex zeteki]|uniref:WD repeat-containing protein 74 n=1 Tax=Mycetomoellerius zeteki TaxID=64791 RepID=A0A151X8Y0_9HYME|nr:PREDICTED: WD repeat-containing protein 74 [Trachymyrmex zeteki]KYQ56823.1 WD repeat-containing protein 74 [Trachymyrmex zeteki]